MEFRSLNIQETLKEIFGHITVNHGVNRALWLGGELLQKLPRIEKKNWLSIFSLEEHEYGTFEWEDSLERMWVWEQAMNIQKMTSLKIPGKEISFSFIPVSHSESKELIGLFVIENSGLDLFELQGFLNSCSRHLGFCQELAQSKAIGYVDDLTSLFNHRYLPKILSQEIDRCQRKDQKFSLLFLDMDYFKKVNDGHGHLMGSRLLMEVAQILKRAVRSYDPLFRYGGDEFLILLVDTDKSTGEKVAERIRRSIESHDFVFEGTKLKLTASIGLSVFPDNAKTAKELIQLADQAMYYGKNKSRNIVYIAS